MACRDSQCAAHCGCGEAQYVFLACSKFIHWHCECCAALRCYVQHLRTLAHLLAVGKELPIDAISFERGEVEAVCNLKFAFSGIYCLKCYVAVGIFHFCHSGMWVAVGVYYTVAQEVGIRRAVHAIVAAVGEVMHAVGIGCVKALVHPVPDETALQIGVAIDFFPLVPKATGGVTHSVSIFRRAHGAVAAVFAHAMEPLCSGILWHYHIGVPLIFGALVAHGTVHIVFLGFLHHHIGLIEVITVAGFVAKRPNCYARMVLIALKHIHSAIFVLTEPLGIITKGGIEVVVHGVALDICLVVYIYAIFVAEFVESAILRIVAGAHGIDVVEFHQFEVLAHQLFGHIVAGGGIMLVYVHALEFYGLAVDEQCCHGAAAWRFLVEGLDFDAAEAHVLWHIFAHLAVLFYAHHQFIEVRRFRRPGLHFGQLGFEVRLCGGISLCHYCAAAALYHCADGIY